VNNYMVRKSVTIFLYFIIVLVIISLVKMSFAYIYECKPNHETDYKINFYIFQVESNESLNNMLSSSSPILLGNATIKINNNNIIIEKDNSTELIKMVYKDGSYWYVLRNGKMLNAGISPFYLPKPCIDPLYRNIFKFSYLNIDLKYNFVTFSGYSKGTFHDFGLVLHVIYPGKTRFFKVYYASGVGIDGEFIIPADALLIHTRNINSSKLYIFSYSIDLKQNKQLPSGLTDVYPIAIPGIAFGLTLIIYGLKVMIRGRR